MCNYFSESRKVLSGFSSELNEICDELINVIKQKRTEDNILHNFDEIMKMMSLEAACSLILGRRMGYLSDNCCDINDEGRNKMKELGSCLKNIFQIFRDDYYGIVLKQILLKHAQINIFLLT